MIIREIQLKNYRNHTDKNFKFTPKISLIVGENGSGKTNIIEAINFASTGRPFKARYDREIISHGKDGAVVKALVKRENSSQENGQAKEHKIGILVEKSERYENASSKTVKIDGKGRRIGALSKVFNTVLFSPLDMDLLTGSPSTRRDYMDKVLTQSDPKYGKNLTKYTKARRQRNKILEMVRETRGGYAQLNYWDEKVLSLGQEIQEAREKWVEYINDILNLKVEKIDDRLESKLVYEKSPINRKKLDNYRPREIAAGTSLIGPHREDFTLMHNGVDLARYASRGQQRTLILVLKLCELEFLEHKVGERPVLLLDDIFSELDEKHKSSLEKVVHSQQTILTATDIPKGFESVLAIWL